MKHIHSKLAIGALMACIGTAQGIDGEIPPNPGTVEYNANLEFYQTLEAMCGVGATSSISGPTHENNNWGTGVLVAPNMVMTARHVFTQNRIPNRHGVTDLDTLHPGFDETSTDPNRFVLWENYGVIEDGVSLQRPKFSVSFRLKQNGTDVGTLAGRAVSFFQVPVKRVVTVDAGMILLILADNEDDQSYNSLFQAGWITHIPFVPLNPIYFESRAKTQGAMAAYGPTFGNFDPAGVDRGVLRYTVFSDFVATPFTGTGQGTVEDPVIDFVLPAHLEHLIREYNPINNPEGRRYTGDSGMAGFAQTESGRYIHLTGIVQGIGNILSLHQHQASWELFFGTPGNPPTYGVPELLPFSEFDVTKNPSPTNSGFDPDWAIQTADVLAMAAARPSLASANWDDSTPLDALDFQSYSDNLFLAPNPYFVDSLFPLFPGASDVHPDGRLNIADADALSALIGSTDTDDLTHDYNESGIIDQGDVDILNTVLSTLEPELIPGQPRAEIYDLGLIGDINNDDVVDCTDRIAFESNIALFDGRSVGDAGYSIALDAKLDHVLDEEDIIVLSARFLPGDYSTGSAAASDEYNPDDILTEIDARNYMYSAGVSLLRPNPIPPAGLDTSGFFSVSRDEFTPPDGVFNVSDIRWTLHAWTETCPGDFGTGTLLDFSFLDLNADQRLNIEDMRELELNLSATNLPTWDYTNNNVIDSTDLDQFTRVITTRDPATGNLLFGQGFLGDFDGSATPSCSCPSSPVSYENCQDSAANSCSEPQIDSGADCSDLTAMLSHTGGLDDLFGNNYFYGNLGYIVQLDGDLDGDMDADDRRIVLHHFQPGDYNLDGVVDFFDTSSFLDDFGGGDFNADINNDGMLDFFDVSEFLILVGSPIVCP